MGEPDTELIRSILHLMGPCADDDCDDLQCGVDDARKIIALVRENDRPL